MNKTEEIILNNQKVIKELIENGASDKEVSEKLDISYSSWKRYKKENADLKKLILEAKDTRNQEVEQALYKNCIGYEYKEEIAQKVKEEVVADDGVTVLTKEYVVVKKVKKYSKPDLAAQKYWLNNQQKAKWKDDPHKVANDKKLTDLKKKEVESKVWEE